MAQEFTKIIEIQLKSSDLVGELSKLTQSIQELIRTQHELDAAYKKGGISEADYAKQTTQNKEAIKAISAQYRQYSSELQANIKVAKSSEESFNQLSAQYTANTAKLNAMSAAERENSAAGIALSKSTEEIRIKMSKMNESIGNHTLSVGNYGKAFNGVNIAMQQVMREVPNLALSPQIFFLAISNNIPILMDQINALKAANLAAAESGNATVSVGKALVKSIFSWQSAMTVGILLLTMYGAKVVDWIGGLFKASNAIDIVKAKQEGLNKVHEEAAKSASQELGKLELLYKASQDQTKSMKERNSAIKQMKEAYPEYFGQMTNEQILAGKSSAAYDKLRNSIIEVARARAAEKIISEYEEKILANEIKIAEEKRSIDEMSIELSKRKTDQKKQETNGLLQFAKAIGATGTETNVDATTKPVDILSERIDKSKTALKELTKENEKYNIVINNIANSVDTFGVSNDSASKYIKTLEKETKKANAELDKMADKWNEFLGIKAKKGSGGVITGGAEQPDANANETNVSESPEILTKKQILQEKMNALQLQAENEIYLAQENEARKNQIAEEAAQARIDMLKNLSDEERESIFESQSAYTNAVLEAENAKQKAIKQTKETSQKATEQQLTAVGNMFGAMSTFMEEFGGQNEAMAILSKGLAIVEIGLNTAKAVSAAIAAGAGVPFPGNLISIVTGVTAVLSAMVQAKQALSSTKMPENDVKAVKRPKFHTGGLVRGSGEVDATLLAGEYVSTTRATSMFSGALSAMEYAANGNRVSLNNYQGGQGMEFFKEAFASALREMKAPIVSVQEITRVSNRIKIADKIAKT